MSSEPVIVPKEALCCNPQSKRAITPRAITPRAITSHRLGPSLYKPRSGSFSTLYRRELVFLNRLNSGHLPKRVSPAEYPACL
jgi:hypothetical protein